MDYRYKAFISYRHQSPDQDIARKLHTYIENYAIPGGLKKSLGVTKMGRVFRDQEELPLSSNLGDDIHEALEQSEWLICICSPRYLQSKWCLEEVRYFLSLGRRDRILTVLAEGEPETAFPETLRFRDTEDGPEEVEPLAADVRAGAVAESLKKLQNEKLRIMAPMLGVHYDDLRQRAKQRRSRVIMAAGAAVILLLSGFLGFAFRKNAQITDERNAALASQSKYLAQAADGLLERGGDRMLALLLAKEALPADFADPDRPVTDEAVYALRSTLFSGVSHRYAAVTDFDVTVKDFGANGATLAVCSDDVPGYLACYDLATGREKEYPWKLEKSPYQVKFSYDLMSFFYADTSGIHWAHRLGSDYLDALVYEDNYLHFYDPPMAVNKDGDKFVYSLTYSLIVDPGIFNAYRPYKMKENETVSDGGSDSISISDAVLFPSEAFETNNQYSMLFLTQVFDRGDADVSLLKVDPNETTFHGSILYNYWLENVNANGEHVYGGTDYEDFVKDYAPSWDGKHIIGLTAGGIYVWDTFTQKQVAAVSFTAFDQSRLKSMRVSSANSRIAVKTESGSLYVYDFATGEVTAMSTAGHQTDSFCFNSDGTMLLCSLAEGADLLCADVGEELGLPLTAVLPMEKADYCKDFPEADRLRFHHHCDRAEAVFVSPRCEAVPAEADADDLYRQAGIYVAAHCRVLLALWDGGAPSPNGCGTAEAVAFALEGAYAPRGSMPLRNGDNTAVLHVFTPRGDRVGRPAGEQAWLGDTAALDAALRHTDDYNRLAEKTDGGYALIPDCGGDAVLEKLQAVYCAADVISIANAARYRRVLALLAAASTVIAAAFLLYDNVGLSWMILLCGVMLLGAWACRRYAASSRCHERYIDCRVLAESLRVQLLLRYAGSGQEAANLFTWSQREENGWVLCALASLNAGPAPAVQRSIQGCWVEDQRAYHKKALEKTRRTLQGNDRIVGAALWCSVALYGIVLAVELLLGGMLFPPVAAVPDMGLVRTVLKVVLGSVSALTLFASNFYGKLSLPRKLSDHEKMARFYDLADRQLERLGQTEELLGQLARQELAENANWCAYQRDNKPDFNL